MIDAKNLAKAMKSAAKGGGYKIFVPKDGENLYIWTDLWCVVLSALRVPRMVLGTIVEQTGELPTPGACGVVTKDGVQTLLQEAAKEEVNAWAEENAKNEVFVKAAPIRYHGMLIYQAKAGPAILKVYATTGAGISIIERSFAKSAIVTDDSRLFYVDDGEYLILRCSRPTNHPGTPGEELPVWAALESCDLGAVE